jgi:hypothetical protein
LLAGLAAIATLGTAAAAQAQAVVVRSTGPSATAYPQGKRLAANSKVTLKAGDRVTVLDKAGTRVLAGPGSFTLDAKIARDTDAASRVSGVLASAGGTRTRTGAVRGAPMGPVQAAPSGPDSVWYIDVSKGGDYCVGNPASLVLWRPNRDQEASGKLTAMSGGKTVRVTWRAGSPLKMWPAELPVSEGSVYTFSDPVGPTVTIKTHVLPSVPADELEVAELLADRGCTAQLDVFANAATLGG